MSNQVNQDRIGLHMQSHPNAFALYIGDKKDAAASRWRSALQNPDLNQHEVDTMIRRNSKTRKAAFRWDRLLKEHGTANSNG